MAMYQGGGSDNPNQYGDTDNPGSRGKNDQGGGGGAPPENSAETWYRTIIQAQPEKYDTNIPKSVWLSVYDLWNPKTNKFKSLKANGDGSPQTGEVDKPWDCSDGTQAWGDSMCLQPGDPRLLQGNPGAQPPPPPVSGAGDGIITSKAPVADNGLYDLQQALIEKFQGRQGIFGMADSRNPASGTAGDLFAKSLNNGGLWWSGDKSMFDPGNMGVSLVPPGGSVGSKPPVVKAAGSTPGVTGGTGTDPVMRPFDTYLQRPKVAQAAASPLADAVAQKFKPSNNAAPWWAGVGA